MDSIPIATSRASDLRKPKHFLLYFQQFPEIVAAEHCVALFQTLIIKHKTFPDILIKYLGCPLAEVCGTPGVDTIAV